MSKTNTAAKFTPAGGKPVDVVTMADVRFSVWCATKSHDLVIIEGSAVQQGGKVVGRIDGEVTGG